jgi:hypothetical protein
MKKQEPKSVGSVIALMRDRLKTIAPYPAGCVGLEGRPAMAGTDFFPGGDGFWNSSGVGDTRLLQTGGVLVLGSDFGDVAWYEKEMTKKQAAAKKLDGKTWNGLLAVINEAKIPEETLFCTNAWPCLREGNQAVKGGIPGQRDKEFTARCLDFLKLTIDQVRPRLVIMLGLAPTGFVANLAPDIFCAWVGGESWKSVDTMPSAVFEGIWFVPIVHPSMPNLRHRVGLACREAQVLQSAWTQTSL